MIADIFCAADVNGRILYANSMMENALHFMIGEIPAQWQPKSASCALGELHDS